MKAESTQWVTKIGETLQHDLGITVANSFNELSRTRLVQGYLNAIENVLDTDLTLKAEQFPSYEAFENYIFTHIGCTEISLSYNFVTKEIGFDFRLRKLKSI